MGLRPSENNCLSWEKPQRNRSGQGRAWKEATVVNWTGLRDWLLCPMVLVGKLRPMEDRRHAQGHSVEGYLSSSVSTWYSAS